MKVAIGS